MCLERLVVVVMEGKWQSDKDLNLNYMVLEASVLPLHYHNIVWSLTTESNCVNLVPKTSGQPMTQRERERE